MARLDVEMENFKQSLSHKCGTLESITVALWILKAAFETKSAELLSCKNSTTSMQKEILALKFRSEKKSIQMLVDLPQILNINSS